MRPKLAERVSLQRFLADTPKRLGSVTQRTKDQEEKWILSALFCAMNDISHSADAWITHREMPDFLLELSGARLGIEVSEVINNRTAKARRALAVSDAAEADDDAPEEDKGASRAEHGSPGEIVRPINEYHPDRKSRPWVGHEPELEVAELMLARLKKKAIRANLYNRFDELWVVLYQNMFVPSPDTEVLLNVLRERLTPEILTAFDWAIVVTSGSAHTIFGGSASASLSAPGSPN